MGRVEIGEERREAGARRRAGAAAIGRAAVEEALVVMEKREEREEEKKDERQKEGQEEEEEVKDRGFVARVWANPGTKLVAKSAAKVALKGAASLLSEGMFILAGFNCTSLFAFRHTGRRSTP